MRRGPGRQGWLQRHLDTKSHPLCWGLASLLPKGHWSQLYVVVPHPEVALINAHPGGARGQEPELNIPHSLEKCIIINQHYWAPLRLSGLL